MIRIQRVSQLLFLLCMAWIFIGVSAVQASTIDLTEWAFNLNGTLYTPSDPLPVTINHSAFDWSTGLGTITVNGFGVGSNTFHTFFDHEIDEPDNTFFNEYGDVAGTPAAGQSWEIDEPGYSFGDIYTNFSSGSLDNSNGVPSTSPDDVSMAMGWGFTLNPGETASINLVLGTALPSGFYLAQTDPDSPETIYFSSTLTINPFSVPEPGTWLLIGTGIVSIAVLRYRLRSKVN